MRTLDSIILKFRSQIIMAWKLLIIIIIITAMLMLMQFKVVQINPAGKVATQTVQSLDHWGDQILAPVQQKSKRIASTFLILIYQINLISPLASNNCTLSVRQPRPIASNSLRTTLLSAPITNMSIFGQSTNWLKYGNWVLITPTIQLSRRLRWSRNPKFW